VIDIRLLRESPDAVRTALARRGPKYDAAITEIIGVDRTNRERLTALEQLKAERNRGSEEVARLKKAKQDAARLLQDLKGVSDRIATSEQAFRETDDQLAKLLLSVPNLPLSDVPAGDARANVVLRSWGTAPTFAFTPKPHWELGAALGILDLPRGAKLSGSGFPVFLGMGARLVRGLINFLIDLQVKDHGYVEVAPPILVNADTARGTGQLPDHEGNMYVTADGLYLIPTAEVPVTNLHRDEILGSGDVPRGYVAYTPCFRREAGAHGKDTRGILRVHQFDKVELVRFARPEDSPAEHEALVGHVEAAFRKLEIPYRVVLLAAGDMGFASAKTYDLEGWAAGVEAWLEISSASTFTDFQARRANIRYRPRADAKPEFVHTLNASALGFPRTLIALLENNQQADGSVRIPSALVPYMGTDRLVPGAA
jgi:seryl-tRNA synthetase